MKRVVILTTQDGDWEGLYIDGNLIDEAHTLGEGNSRLYLLKKAEEFKFTSDDICIHELEDDDDDNTMEMGGFPIELSTLSGEYGKEG